MGRVFQIWSVGDRAGTMLALAIPALTRASRCVTFRARLMSVVHAANT